MSQGFTKQQVLDTDPTLAGDSDYIAPSQSAVKAYVDNQTHDASDITSGTMATARLGSGTASASTALHGDQTYKTVREVLSANRTYYVRADGSNSNTGLGNTAGTAFLTIAKAVETAYGLDTNGKTITIQVGDGTWSTAISISGALVGNGQIALLGNTITPSNCLITAGISVSNWVRVSVNGFRISNTSIICLSITNFATVSVGGNVEFGSCTAYQIYVASHGNLIGGNYEIVAVGVNNTHLYMTTNATATYTVNTITLSGTLAYYRFVEVLLGATLSDFSGIWTGGTITGQRYYASLNGAINTFGGGANVYPGDAAGATATGGQYA